MVAKNMAQLNNMLMKQVKKAMNVASDKMLADMYEETAKFYTKGEPVMYERTGALGNTPKVTAPTESSHANGGSVNFNAYLDTSTKYTSGKNPTMEDVLNLANYGITQSSVGTLRKTVGQGAFWEKSKDKMEKTLNETMGKFFK